MADKILIVDDEINIRELLRFNLTKAGYVTCEADNGNDAVKSAKNEKPNLMVLDLMLPGDWAIPGIRTSHRSK
jgi:two-component system alkaline phosphatase synthesis response regulator PhoP